MTVRMQMALMIVPMLQALSYFAWPDILGPHDDMRAAHEVYQATQDIEAISDLTHELQKERGYSSGFMASSGANFAGEIVA